MNLNAYYKKYNETDTSFAPKAGLNQPTMWRIRKLKVVPRADTALKIKNAAKGKVTVSEIVYPEGEPN